MKVYRNLIFQPIVKNYLEENSFKYFDVGARGDIEEPWSMLDESCIDIVGFETDETEVKRLISKYPNRRYLPYGLWDAENEITFYLTEGAAASSVFEPNLNLLKNHFAKKHWIKREVAKKSSVRVNSLDRTCKDINFTPDFLKIDVHGAEYEILRGAEHSLKDTLGVFVEAWVLEAHKDQKLFGDVFNLLYSQGFHLMKVNPDYMSWGHIADDSHGTKSAKQVVGINMFFLKKDAVGLNESKKLKLILLAELFGFVGFASQMISQLSDNELRENLQKLIKERSLDEAQLRQTGIGKKLINRIVRFLTKRLNQQVNYYQPKYT